MSAAHVIIVDDEPDISTVLALTLRRAGYRVSTAFDGAQGLAAIQAEPPDLVLLDVMMPRLDGFETLRRIREHPATALLPVIMLTARTQLADRMKGFARGADDYVPKPFEPTEVVARVEAVLRRAAAARLAMPLMGLLGDWASDEALAQLGRDLEAAREIQERLLPSVPAALAGLEAGAALRPSAVVGGDFFDFVPMADRVGVAVGDVAGKGIPAALLMVMVRTLLRELARELTAPAEVLARLNASLCRDMPPSMFVTMVLVALDRARPGTLAVASGGHPPPLRLRRGQTPEPIRAEGALLGVFEEAAFEQTELVLRPGDSLLLYTDGITDSVPGGGERPGLAGLIALVATCQHLGARALAEAVVDNAVRRSRGPMRDDLTALALRRADTE
jgi:sigma-B regulation protein RsbU (phosphoserine phosphatase)